MRTLSASFLRHRLNGQQIITGRNDWYSNQGSTSSVCCVQAAMGVGFVPGAFVLVVEPVQLVRHRLHAETAAAHTANEHKYLCYVQRVMLEPQRRIPTAA